MIRRLLPRHAGLGLVAFLLSLIVLGGFGTASMTDATWKSEQDSVGDFEAGQIGPIRNVVCEAPHGLFSAGIELNWDVPEQFVGREQDVEYVISWQGTGLLSGTKGTTTTTEPEFKRNIGGLALGLPLSITVTVHAKLVGSEWQGEHSVTTSASGILVLGLGEYNCNK